MNQMEKDSIVAPMVVPMKMGQFVEGGSWKRLEDHSPCYSGAVWLARRVCGCVIEGREG